MKLKHKYLHSKKIFTIESAAVDECTSQDSDTINELRYSLDSTQRFIGSLVSLLYDNGYLGKDDIEQLLPSFEVVTK